MFGMLDYRAHKLLWLLFVPVRICNRLSLLAATFISIFIIQLFHFSIPVKIVLALVLSEAIGGILMAIWSGVSWLVKKVFFWTIDIIPAQGKDAEEAHAIVLHGKLITLGKKFTSDIENLSLEEMGELSRLYSNWRSNILFKARERVGKRIMLLWQHHGATGQQPADMSQEEIKKVVGHLEFTSFETLVSSGAFFNSFVNFLIIVVFFVYVLPPS
jgi:hypothetical protein